MKKRFDSFYVLGVRIDKVTFQETVNYILELAINNQKALITTPNPEIVLLAHKDQELKKIINASDLAIPDGVGICWAFKFLGFGSDLQAVKGRSVAGDLIHRCALKKIKIALIGDSDKNAIILSKKYNNEYIKGFIGPLLKLNGFPQTKLEENKEELLLKELKKFFPQIILVGFGAPKQEKWLVRVLPRLNNAVGMVVGGTFDYMSGKIALPPKIFERFEWLWRLLIQPKRAIRITKAIIVFPFYVFLSKLNFLKE